MAGPTGKQGGPCSEHMCGIRSLVKRGRGQHRLIVMRVLPVSVSAESIANFVARCLTPGTLHTQDSCVRMLSNSLARMFERLLFIIQRFKHAHVCAAHMLEMYTVIRRSRHFTSPIACLNFDHPQSYGRLSFPHNAIAVALLYLDIDRY